MHTQYFTAKYGVATTIYFTLRTPSGTDSNTLFVGTAPTAGDMELYKDGVWDTGDESDAAPAIADTGGGYDALYSWAISAAELQCDRLDVIVHDPGGTFRDAHLVVLTTIDLSEVDIDAATGTKANTTALKLSGYGSGHGLECVAGATGNDIEGALGKHVLRSNTAQAGGSAGNIVLDSSASSSNDFYNGSLILIHSGTGAGQARAITDYVGSTTTATINKSWVTNPDATSEFIIVPGPDTWNVSPGAELSATPTATSYYAQMLQFLFQRFVYKRTQTSDTFSMKKADGSTELSKATLSDDGTTQTHGALADP
jgi:hypothetical protein